MNSDCGTPIPHRDARFFQKSGVETSTRHQSEQPEHSDPGSARPALIHQPACLSTTLFLLGRSSMAAY